MTGPDPRLRFLWHYARPWKHRILLALLGLTFVSLASLLYHWLLKHHGTAGQRCPPVSHRSP